jgi:cell division protein FtsI (penicillin-binding protein 3)
MPRRGRRSVTTALGDGRVRLLSGLVLVALLVIAGRATLLAATSHDLSAIAARQQTATVSLTAHRGAILDRTGKQLAVGREQQTVYATPSMLKDPEAAARRLAAVLKVKVGPLRRALSDHASGFAYVARTVDPALARKAVKLGIKGVGSYPEEARLYPMKKLAAQVIGFAGTENKGLAGLELQFDKELAGRNGSQEVVRDPTGRVLGTEKLSAPVDGRDVRLTIDADIQFEAENILARTVRSTYAKAATALVMDPRDGSILAMVNAPLIDANHYGRRPQYTRNRVVTDIFEPGSIFKAVTVAAAIEEGLVTPDTEFVLPPSLRVGDKVIHEAHPRGTETFSVRRILVESSNVGAATLGIKLGKARLMEWISAFGFGRKTGVEYPGEVPGLAPGYWSLATLGNVPMGQGISTTVLQMATAYATLGNGGVAVRPWLVAQVGDKVRPPEAGRRVVSEHTAAQVLDMMTEVVDKGTGTEAQIPGYKVAGKTGTAQKVLAGQAGYAKGRYYASFVLMVPARDPQLLVMVVADEPHPIWGGVVAAPAARDIAEFALAHLKIAP